MPVDDLPDQLVSRWCAAHLGSPATAQFFGMRRLSAVHGVRLADGRRVAVKVRVAEPRLHACARVHEALWTAGIPCPRPLAGPAALAEAGEPVLVAGDGGGDPVDARWLAVTAETWEGEGDTGVGEPDAATFAQLLARMVAAAPPVADLPTLEPAVPWLWWDHVAVGRTWPPAASERWDPHRIAERLPTVITDTARRARARLLAPDVVSLPRVAGHGDLTAQNCRWVPGPDGGQRLVVHDWDSIVARPEAVLAGNSALTYLELDAGDISSLDQHEHFVEAYAEARGRPWSRVERQAAHATAAWVASYNAAFEYLKGGPGTVAHKLADQAAERLARAGA